MRVSFFILFQTTNKMEVVARATRWSRRSDGAEMAAATPTSWARPVPPLRRDPVLSFSSSPSNAPALPSRPRATASIPWSTTIAWLRVRTVPRGTIITITTTIITRKPVRLPTVSSRTTGSSTGDSWTTTSSADLSLGPTEASRV